MNKKKTLFDVMFIILSGAILLGLNEGGLLEKNMGFALIPILVAYFLGQYSKTKYSD